MTGKPEQFQQSSEAVQTARQNMEAAYGIAIPGVRRQQGVLQAALAQGEPGYQKAAFDVSRGILGDAAATQEQSAVAQARGLSRQAAGGGNLAAQQAFGQNYGSRLAQAMYSSRINEASANVEQMDKVLGFMTGASQQAGSGALSAMGAQIGAIPYLRQYDPTYANVVAALNAGGTLYGVGQQAGWFNTKSQIPTTGNTFASVSQGMSPAIG